MTTLQSRTLGLIRPTHAKEIEKSRKNGAQRKGDVAEGMVANALRFSKNR